MITQDVQAIEVGDRIEFRSLTRWNNGARAIRLVKAVTPNGVEVRYSGYGAFHVRQHEILNVVKASQGAKL